MESRLQAVHRSAHKELRKRGTPNGSSVKMHPRKHVTAFYLSVFSISVALDGWFEEWQQGLRCFQRNGVSESARFRREMNHFGRRIKMVVSGNKLYYCARRTCKWYLFPVSGLPANNPPVLPVLPVIWWTTLNKRPKPPPLASHPTTRERFAAALCRPAKVMTC